MYLSANNSTDSPIEVNPEPAAVLTVEESRIDSLLEKIDDTLLAQQESEWRKLVILNEALEALLGR